MKAVAMVIEKIGKLERVELREIWKNEARDFTSWLKENIDILSEALDMPLSAIEREKKTGSFFVDIVAEDNAGNTVIIENQLEKTDHDHLGKLVTYLSNLEAKTAIWISSNPRNEHIKTISWLNETTPADIYFYLVKVDAVRIEDSPPAPLFTVVCGPSEETKKIGEEKKELAERHRLRLKFWETLLEKAGKKTPLHENISPSKYNWIGTGAGVAGLSYDYDITKDSGSIELYIDKGKDSEQINKQIFDRFYAKKEEIEKDFGDTLSWKRLDERRACRIRKVFPSIGWKDDEDKWAKLQDKMIDGMIRFEAALGKHIKKLKI